MLFRQFGNQIQNQITQPSASVSPFQTPNIINLSMTQAKIYQKRKAMAVLALLANP